MPSKLLKVVPPIAAHDRIVTFRVDLLNVSPKIWRRVEIPSSFTLGDVHDVMQIVMGWDDSHLHVFRVGTRVFSLPSDESEFEPATADSDSVTLESLSLFKKGKRFFYDYDFGDGWQHQLEVESVRKRLKTKHYPFCIKAVGACPPEDCGGPHQYKRLLRISKNPNHADHIDAIDGLGEDFDPKAVDLAEINDTLAQGFRQ